MIPVTSHEACREGVRTALPFMIPLGLIYVGFGTACAGQGVGLGQTIAMSALIYSTPLQLLLLEMADEPVLIVLPLILAINARFILLASSLAPALRSASLPGLIGGATFLIPTVYAAMQARLARHGENAFAFYLGMGVSLYVVTQIATYGGAIAGRQLAAPVILDASRFALALFLVLMAAQLWPSRRLVSAFVLGALIAPVSLPILGGWAMVGLPMCIGLAFSKDRKRWAR